MLVETLASLGNLQVKWSPAASQRINNRNAQIALDGVPLLDAVVALGACHGLVCQVNGLVLEATTEEEAPKESLGAWRLGETRQALRKALLADAGHPLAAAAYLRLGNDEAVAGKWNEAIAWYDRLINEAPRSGNVTTAYFNLGLVQRARKDHAEARKDFYRVVDRNPGHELATQALVQIGLTLMTEGQPLEALLPLRRALTTAPASTGRAEALLAISAACLLAGNPQEANKLLTANRQYVSNEPWRTTAAFLDGLARFRVAAASKKSSAESAELVATLLAFQNHAALGCVGRLLAGQAYQELGLPQQMAKIYEDAQTTAAGSVSEEMRYRLAEHLWSQGKREPALSLLRELAVLPQSKWPCAVRLRLAGIALEVGNAQECVRGCNALLTEGAGAERSAVLRLLGAAYEHTGDYDKAARCYAGKLPE